MDVALSQKGPEVELKDTGWGGVAIRSSLCLALWVRRVRVTDQTALRRRKGGAWEARSMAKHTGDSEAGLKQSPVPPELLRTEADNAASTARWGGSPDVSGPAAPVVGETHSFRRP